MKYCIVNDNKTIINIIVCDSEEYAKSLNAVISYDGAKIGDTYSPPPPPPTTEERIATLESDNDLLKQQLKAASDQNDFLENCISEMAEIVYA